uniref:Uncharacterized protein n=1 Tax=Arundo donax TaxID=35708 RepID=A0A0A9AZL3_ARUDO
MLLHRLGHRHAWYVVAVPANKGRHQASRHQHPRVAAPKKLQIIGHHGQPQSNPHR